MTRVSVLIPTHNRRDLLGRTLDSLAAVRVPAGVAVEVIAVANNCTDGTEQLVAERAAGHSVRPALPQRVGVVSGGEADGVERAGGGVGAPR